jgi:hypothetical protein
MEKIVQYPLTAPPPLLPDQLLLRIDTGLTSLMAELDRPGGRIPPTVRASRGVSVSVGDTALHSGLSTTCSVISRGRGWANLWSRYSGNSHPLKVPSIPSKLKLALMFGILPGETVGHSFEGE